MLIQKKYLIIPLFCLIMLFGFGEEVGAVDWYSIECPPPTMEGNKMAVFVVTNNENTQSLNKSIMESSATEGFVDPVDGQHYCIEVKANRVELYFEELVAARLPISQSDAGSEGHYQVNDANKWPDRSITPGDAALFPDTDYKLIDIRYLLKRATSQGNRIRYHFEKVSGVSNLYLYFMGYGKINGGLIAPIQNKTCWDSDEATCKTQYKDQCFWYPIPNVHNCQSRIDPAICGSLPENYCGEKNKIGSYACVWNSAENKCLTILKDSVQQNYGRPKGYEGPLPTCAFSGDCDNVNDILQLVVNFAWGGLLSIIGGTAFLMFVWAGFTIILSFGNPEKVKKGWHMMISAVVGMAIAFGAYLLIDFILTTLDVPTSLRGIGR